MIEPESAPEHYTVAEFQKALGELTEADFARLRQLARNRCRRHYPGREEECLNEAIMRTLEGRRRWPLSENLFAFLSMTMKSIVDGWVTAEEGHDSDLVDELPSRRNGAAAEVFEKEVKDRLMALFEDDEDATIIVEGWFEGFEKQDYLDVFGNDETKYETVRKRVRRKMSKHGPEMRELINGD